MVTTKLASEWVRVFSHEKLTVALLDRLTHGAHILTPKGASYRSHGGPDSHRHRAVRRRRGGPGQRPRGTAVLTIVEGAIRFEAGTTAPVPALYNNHLELPTAGAE